MSTHSGQATLRGLRDHRLSFSGGQSRERAQAREAGMIVTTTISSRAEDHAIGMREDPIPIGPYIEFAAKSRGRCQSRISASREKEIAY
jgi:hypothetical protein